MEIEEHSPGQGKPATPSSPTPCATMHSQITPRCMVGVWCEHGARGQDAGEACNLYMSSHIPRQPQVAKAPPRRAREASWSSQDLRKSEAYLDQGV